MTLFAPAEPESARTDVWLLPGSHLFDTPHLPVPNTCRIFMAEDWELCTRVRHHQQKLVLFLAAMRCHRDRLREAGYSVEYHEVDPEAPGFWERLSAYRITQPFSRIHFFEIEDRFFASALERWAGEEGVAWVPHPSPMFLSSRRDFSAYLESTSKPFMKTYYEAERKRRHILMDPDGKPRGGKYSFDPENRKRLPPDVAFPPLRRHRPHPHVEDVRRWVSEHLAHHPGDVSGFHWPVNHEQARAQLMHFLRWRLPDFGTYEDALTLRDDQVFHSMLTPAMNMGLLTPAEILDSALERGEEGDVPLNSLEGFVRQIMGWREFIHGMDACFGEKQSSANFFQHTARLKSCWWEGTTGLLPLDRVIEKAQRLGWAHHIERLMVAGNLMLLCGVHPGEAYRWFMEMFVDSADWVMGPNVYGMSQFADGGLFATKPYICGSNYLLKMGDYPKGGWCDVMDGLYWGFIGRHREVFAANPRMSMAVRTLDRMDRGRLRLLEGKAEAFRDKVVSVN